MTAMMDAEEYYYQLVDEHEDRHGDLDDEADEALAAFAEQAAASHNAKVCPKCDTVQSAPVRDVCDQCRRTELAAQAEAELPELDRQIAELQARRDRLAARLED
ncbi:hypothetical protein [Gordonia alkanivorans]|uniref:hypothetical protein n=1 Tax=Gordonia alkanivorans TaxID=84096 RepID=UPI0004AE1BB1|nr:hypothetical protein [Gordonia alkanivorans]